MEAATAKDETGAALDVATVEAEALGDIMKEGDVEILTIESSPEWGGTLIEEENGMEEARKSTEKGNVPSTSATELEILVP